MSNVQKIFSQSLVAFTLFGFSVGFASATERQVNVPHFNGDIEFTKQAIFWFGKFDGPNNFSDVRVGYTNDKIQIHVNTADSFLWYNPNFSKTDYKNWDSLELYINTAENSSSVGAQSYKFVVQLDWNEDDNNYKASFKGADGVWQDGTIEFTPDIKFRGSPNNETGDDGWNVKLSIPFSSFGLSAPPAEGSIWKMGLKVYDHDNANAIRIPYFWPETLDENNPNTWGKFHFGNAIYNNGTTGSVQTVTIKNGVNGAVVKDIAVGGHSVCGNGFNHWNQWPFNNQLDYAADGMQFNVQNQFDMSDRPCFSKYYSTYPLAQIPNGATIVSAKLAVKHFGNSYGEALGETTPVSQIQTFTFDENINDETNWNNAPMAVENISVTEVAPLKPNGNVWPAPQIREFDVTYAVAKAVETKNPNLNIGLYSADSDRHTGKYFNTSRASEADRPALIITYTMNNGEVCEAIFPDICDNQFRNYIENLNAAGVVQGYGDGLYHPELPVSRAQLAKFIVLGLEIPEDTSGAKFTDVDENNGMFKYIQTLKNTKIIQGYPDGSFHPEYTVTREQASKFLAVGMQYKGIKINGFTSSFPDVSDANNFKSYIAFVSNKTTASGEKIMGGFSSGKFEPSMELNRMQMAKIVSNARSIVKS